jgi:hypothetical protein
MVGPMMAHRPTPRGVSGSAAEAVDPAEAAIVRRQHRDRRSGDVCADDGGQDGLVILVVTRPLPARLPADRHP